jgi:exonuclease SbcC
MIPIKLTIQGLYSYQKKQTIDFTKLTAANLFGIFGWVGSGKSSILEAITFAIYGKTDRLNLSGDNRNYNMMNLKSNELFIEFIFETGKNQTAYKVVVKGRRNSKKFDDVKALERTAYQSAGNSWSPVEPSALEGAIGLSYENFKRTIIIPQGQFQEFLQLGNKDRTKMMKELFNLEKFELYYKVTSLESKNNAQKQTIEGQLQQLGVVDPEQIKVYNQQLVQLKIELNKQDEQLKEHRIQEAQWLKLQELSKKQEASKLAFEKLKKREPQFIQLEKSIQQYEDCVFYFKSSLDSLNENNKKIARKANQIAVETETLKQEELEIVKNENLLINIKPDYEKRETLKQRADELVKLSKIQKLNKSIKNENGRLAKGEQVWKQTVEAVEKLKEKKGNLALWIKTEKKKLPDLAVLSKVKTWHVENKNLEKQKLELEGEVSKIQNEGKIIKQAIQFIYNQSDFENLLEKTSETSIQFLKDKIEAIKLNIKSIDQESSHFRVKEQLEAYADNLLEGKPCPLCGSVHHPEKYSSTSIVEGLNKLEKQKQEYENEIGRITEIINKLNDLDSQFQFNSRYLIERLKKQDGLKKKILDHVSTFKWEVYKNAQQVENAFQLAKQIQNELDKKETEFDDFTNQLEKAIKNKERFQSEIEKIKTGLTVFQTETKTLSGQLIIISSKEYQNRPALDIEKEKEALLLKFDSLEKQFNELTNLQTKLRKIIDTVKGSLNANKRELEQEQKVHIELQKQLDTQLEKSGFVTINEVIQILGQSIELGKQKKLLIDFKQNLILVKTTADQLQKEIGNRIYDADLHQKISSEIASINAILKHRNQELGKISELLKKLQKDMDSQALLRLSLESLELRAENIKTLKSLFKGSGFVNYISSVYLQNLCNAANERFFQMTRQKLSLEITEDNNFQVRDFLNGGKIRSVKTLSGGQTFQAALSLALALADNIQKITESNQNFFFLDEGFGSLDRESLLVVFDTLKSLRKENRIVGVISHVEEMQQEIDVHLRIENHEEEGSLLYRSWE